MGKGIVMEMHKIPQGDRVWCRQWPLALADKHGVNSRPLHCSECAEQLHLLKGNRALRDKSRTCRKKRGVGSRRRKAGGNKQTNKQTN